VALRLRSKATPTAAGPRLLCGAPTPPRAVLSRHLERPCGQFPGGAILARASEHLMQSPMRGWKDVKAVVASLPFVNQTQHCWLPAQVAPVTARVYTLRRKRAGIRLMKRAEKLPSASATAAASSERPREEGVSQFEIHTPILRGRQSTCGDPQ
jgi:hypothetical protein